MKRAIGIVRVSEVGDREGESFASPGIQTDRIKLACERDEIQLLEVLPEIDVSGGTPLSKRTKGLLPAIEAIEDGRADMIMVAYFDRLVRSIKVQTEVVERVEAAGGEVLTLDFGKLTNGTAVQRLTATFMGGVAQFVREQTAEKTAAAQERAVARGVAIGAAPPGYLRGPDKILVPDPATREIVNSAFIRRVEGATNAQVCDFLAENGIKRTITGVRKMLASRTYVGEVHFGKLVNLKAHEAIIDRDLFDRVQRMMVSAGRRSKSERLLARQGVLRCGSCDGRMSVCLTRGNTEAEYSFYRCTSQNCDAPQSIGAEFTEAWVLDEVEAYGADGKGRASAARRAQEAISRAKSDQERLDAATESFLAAGLTAEPSAVETLIALREARDASKAEVERHRSASLGLTVSFSTVLRNGSLDARQKLIRTTVDKVTVSPGKGTNRLSIQFI